jgi:hypothetical protein
MSLNSINRLIFVMGTQARNQQKQANSIAVNIEVIISSETSVFLQSTRSYKPENHILHSCSRENLKFNGTQVLSVIYQLHVLPTFRILKSRLLPSINFRLPEPIFIKLGMYIMSSEPISTVYFMNPFQQSVCLYVYSHIVARQRLGKIITAAMNTHATIEELLNLFSMQFVSYRRKVDD